VLQQGGNKKGEASVPQPGWGDEIAVGS